MTPGIQWGEGLFFFGVAWRLAVWLGKTARELQQDSGDRHPLSMSLMSSRPKATPIQSIAALAPSMTPEQQARVIAMITDAPKALPELQHRCSKCGTLIHADLMNGGFAPCRKCGWSSSPSSSPSSAPVA